MAQLPLLKSRSWRPSYIERAAASQTVQIEVYSGDTASATTPTSGTYTLRDPGGVHLVDAAALSTPFSSYPVLAASVPATLALGEGYSELWTLVISGATYTIERPAALVLRRTYCPLTNADLLERHPELVSYPSGAASWEPAIRQAHAVAERRLIAAGRRPYLVLNSDALYEPELYWALALVFRSLSAYVGEPQRFAELAAYYDNAAEQAWSRVTLTYDEGHDGIPDEGEQGANAGPPVVFLSDTPSAFGWWR